MISSVALGGAHGSRDANARAEGRAGWRTLRFADRQIELAPHTVVRALAAALQTRAA